MEFGLSKQQVLLQESVGKLLDRAAPLERVKQFASQNESRAAEAWQGLCDLEIPALLVPEEYGGLGLSLLEAALVAETLGSRAAPVPFTASVGIVPLAIALAGSKEQQQRWLPQLAEGKTVAGAALTEAVGCRRGAGVRHADATLHGRSQFVLDFEADLYLVADNDHGLYLVESGARGLERHLRDTIDRTRRYGELVFDNTPAERLAGSQNAEICAGLLDAGRILLAADSLGAAQHMLTRAVEYSKQRVQFGRQIGSFQAVKHLCAEMAAELEPCRAMVWYAAHAFDAIAEEARLTACHTKAHLAEVATFVARTAIEVHGGIGFTGELGLHLWFKRIGANRQLLGGPELVREEAARIQLLV